MASGIIIRIKKKLEEITLINNVPDGTKSEVLKQYLLDNALLTEES